MNNLLMNFSTLDGTNLLTVGRNSAEARESFMLDLQLFSIFSGSFLYIQI